MAACVEKSYGRLQANDAAKLLDLSGSALQLYAAKVSIPLSKKIKRQCIYIYKGGN